jgi:cation diffusion facilitator family transporter
LFAGKFAVGVIVGSIAMQADGINNLSDAGSSVISFISFKISEKPADREHPYGHARIEYVASMIVSFIVMIIGFELLKESIGKITSPDSSTEFSIVSIVVLSASILVKLLLGLFNRSIGKRIDSDVMRATAADCFSDALATSAVLASTIIMKMTGFDADGYMGVIVAVIIMIAGVKILWETKDRILGGAPDEETVAAIKEIVSRYPEALGIHDLVVHNYGAGAIIVSLHIEVDGSKDIFESHDMIDMIERRLNTELGIHSNIHMDPIVTNDERTREVHDKVAALVTCIDQRLTIHDFRMVEGPTHTNVIFDVVIPFEIKKSDDEIRKSIETIVKTIDKNYYSVVNIDRSYV